MDATKSDANEAFRRRLDHLFVLRRRATESSEHYHHYLHDTLMFMHATKCARQEPLTDRSGAGIVKVRKGGIASMRCRRGAHSLDASTCSPDDKKGRSNLKKHSSCERDRQACSKPQTGDSSDQSPSLEGTEYAHSPVLFGEVAHSRCPDYGSGHEWTEGSDNDGTDDANDDNDDGNGNESKQGNVSLSTEELSKGDGCNSRTPRDDSDIRGAPDGGPHHHAVHGTVDSSDSRMGADNTEPANKLPETVTTNNPETAQICDPDAQPVGTLFTTQTAQGADSAEWSDVETEQ